MANIEITHAVTTWSYRLGCGLLLATVLISCSFERSTPSLTHLNVTNFT